MSQAENSKPSPSCNSFGWYITHKIILLVIIIAAYLYFNVIPEGLILTGTAIGILAVASATVMAGKMIDFGLPFTCVISFTIAKLIYAQTAGSGSYMLELALVLGVICSGIAGFITGKIITRKYIPPYLGSFAIPCIILFLIYLIFNHSAQSIGEFLSLNNMHEISLTTQYLLVGIPAALTLLYSLSKYGKNLIATGSSLESAIEAGINTDCSIVWAYTISGLLAGAAGILLVNIPQNFIVIADFPVLSWIPAVLLGAVIGGNRFSGGRFDVIGAFFGGIITIFVSTIIAETTQNSIEAETTILLAMLIIVMATDIKKK